MKSYHEQDVSGLVKVKRARRFRQLTKTKTEERLGLCGLIPQKKIRPAEDKASFIKQLCPELLASTRPSRPTGEP